MNKIGEAFVSASKLNFKKEKVSLGGKFPDVWVHELPVPQLREIQKPLYPEDQGGVGKDDDKRSDAWLAINGTFDEHGSRIWEESDLKAVLRDVPGRVLAKLAEEFNRVNGVGEDVQDDIAKNFGATDTGKHGSD